MSDEHQDQLREIHASKGTGGAHQRIGTRAIEDPLFRKLMMWSWGVFGTAFMAMQVWLVSNVADIKAALPRLADKDAQIDNHQAATDHRVDKLEDRYDYVRSKIDQYEGKTLRGAGEPNRGP